MVGIYKITSPSEKIYIGQSNKIERRKKDYLSINKIKCQIKLRNSIIKHGWENHKFEIIEECLSETLNDRERFWQDFYDVLGEKGLNCKLTTSETKTGKLSECVKSKISKSLMGHSVSDKTKIASSIKNKNNKYCLGYKHTKEFLKSVKKPVLQFDMNNVLIKEYESVKEAGELICSRSNPKSRSNNISNCLNGWAKRAYGFCWKYKFNN